MKYYRVLQDTFLWEKGAILKYNGNNGYTPVEDIWNKMEKQDEYITTNLIEHNPEWFERVYEDGINKLVFKTKEQLKEVFNNFIK